MVRCYERPLDLSLVPDFLHASPMPHTALTSYRPAEYNHQNMRTFRATDMTSGKKLDVDTTTTNNNNNTFNSDTWQLADTEEYDCSNWFHPQFRTCLSYGMPGQHTL